MNHAHEATVKELEEKLQEENRTHNESIKEIEEKIANLDQLTRHLPRIETTPSEAPYESPQEMPEPTQETQESPQEMAEPLQEDPTEIDHSARARELQERVRELLQESKPSESEVPPETPKKKKRSLF